MFPPDQFSRSHVRTCVTMVLRVLRTPAGHKPGGVGLKCRVVACSTPVPARSMHGQPLTGRLPVSQILGFQVSGRARRKLTKRRKFPSWAQTKAHDGWRAQCPKPKCPSLFLRGTVLCSIDSPRVVCVCAPLGSRDIAPRFRRTRLRAARLSQWATLIRRTAEWAGWPSGGLAGPG